MFLLLRSQIGCLYIRSPRFFSGCRRMFHHWVWQGGLYRQRARSWCRIFLRCDWKMPDTTEGLKIWLGHISLVEIVRSDKPWLLLHDIASKVGTWLDREGKGTFAACQSNVTSTAITRHHSDEMIGNSQDFDFYFCEWFTTEERQTKSDWLSALCLASSPSCPTRTAQLEHLLGELSPVCETAHLTFQDDRYELSIDLLLAAMEKLQLKKVFMHLLMSLTDCSQPCDEN